jgi:VIT1/CCC1 family predicted Fe2+/Mn2+ transporter
MNRSRDIRRYRENLEGEVNSAALYRAMASAEPQAALAEVYKKLAAVEEKHASFWEEQIRQAGGRLVPRRPSLRTRFMAWLARRFGPDIVLPSIAAAEVQDQGMYDHQPESRSTAMPLDERSHARVLSALVQTAHAGVSGSSLARLEGRHRAIGGNAIRAAVLGGADGLVSNLSLVMGVAGAEMSGHAILVTGLAGLMAGACSMAIGEWVSVQSSRELNKREIAVEAAELEQAPAEEMEELQLIYQAKGIPEAQAVALAQHLIADPAKALDTLAREELGIDPKELGGSAWEAAVTSFCLFAAGAAIPVFPFLWLQGRPGVAVSVALSAVGLYGIGAAITLVTGRSAMRSGLRQLLMGLAAAAITFTIGRLIGVTIAG